MMSPESNITDESVKEFNRVSNLLRDPDGSYFSDVALEIFVYGFLTPTFYSNHPELWREGLKTLYNHVGKSICGTRLLIEVFGREEEIKINGDPVLVKQIDIIRDNDEKIYEAGIEIMNECRENNPSILSEAAKEILENYN
ncbi:hypothetical protein M0Q97_11210 [Candidatus Dojkabacteria bacterium]|nr:hypothetical protein [Candidatus Dojkabacteria bacterium]